MNDNKRVVDPITRAHSFVAEVINHGDLVVDATMGNGHDTAFLCTLTNNVYAFDIQDQAIQNTRARNLVATLIQDCHSNIDRYIKQPIKVAIFNLGYLPGSNKTIITRPETTITALKKVKSLLAPGGRIAIVVYPKHPGGKEEADAVLEWVNKQVDQNVLCMVG